MPNPATVSTRKYNRELKCSAAIRAELEASQENLRLAKKQSRHLRQQLKAAVAESQELDSCREILRLEKMKNSKLEQRLKEVHAPGKRELNAVRDRCRAKHKATLDKTVLAHETLFEKMKADLGDRVKELVSINDKLKRDNERLSLQLNGNVRMHGNLENLDEDPRATNPIHVISGGRAGSV
jgi:hypothetical protein